MSGSNNIRQNYIQAGIEAKEKIHQCHESPSNELGMHCSMDMDDYRRASRLNHIDDPGKSNYKTGTMFVGTEAVDETLGTMYEGQIGRAKVRE